MNPSYRRLVWLIACSAFAALPAMPQHSSKINVYVDATCGPGVEDACQAIMDRLESTSLFQVVPSVDEASVWLHVNVSFSQYDETTARRYGTYVAPPSFVPPTGGLIAILTVSSAMQRSDFASSAADRYLQWCTKSATLASLSGSMQNPGKVCGQHT